MGALRSWGASVLGCCTVDSWNNLFPAGVRVLRKIGREAVATASGAGKAWPDGRSLRSLLAAIGRAEQGRRDEEGIMYGLEWAGLGRGSTGLGTIGVQPMLERLERLASSDVSFRLVVLRACPMTVEGVLICGLGMVKRFIGDCCCWYGDRCCRSCC
jgi:hypothetical protein